MSVLLMPVRLKHEPGVWYSAVILIQRPVSPELTQTAVKYKEIMCLK